MLILIREEINNFINEAVSDALNEGVSDVVYHFTGAYNILKILKTNKIHFSPVTGNQDYDFRINRGKFYYFSLTRSKHKDVGYGSGNVRITLDGKKINQNFKTIPIDYWESGRDPKLRDPKTYGTNKYLYKQMSREYEQEDRIATDKSEMSNALRYILSVDYLIRDGFEQDVKYAEEIKYYCNKLGVDFNAYQTEKDFNYSIKKNRVDIKPIKHDIETERNYGESLPYGFIEIISHITFRREDKLGYFLNSLKEFGFDDKKIELIKEKIKKQWYEINYKTKYGEYPKDSMAVFTKNYIDKHNHNPLLRFAIKELVRDIRKEGYNNVIDYLDDIPWRNKKKPEQYVKEFNDGIIKTIEKRFDELIKENIGYNFHYYTKDGERGDNIFKNQDVLNLLTKWKNILIDYYKKNVLNNPDIWNYNWHYSSWHVVDVIGLKESGEFNMLIDNKFDDIDYVDSNYLKYNIIKTIIDDVENYGNEVWDNMKTEFYKQRSS